MKKNRVCLLKSVLLYRRREKGGGRGGEGDIFIRKQKNNISKLKVVVVVVVVNKSVGIRVEGTDKLFLGMALSCLRLVVPRGEEIVNSVARLVALDGGGGDLHLTLLENVLLFTLRCLAL